ncbi:sensor histidine kinase [Polynucleobacter brandtiae]|uniref:histidine kinase n=1 Tax=Polynucleobacter brandtiae TaxID=1938816 RepID=A0A2M8VJ51_9BURK|nr:ATP-binding protein [Polynucleobacter brandtiae]PJI76952.1 histidine kinase [Polynucleobacter brandtiae]
MLFLTGYGWLLITLCGCLLTGVIYAYFTGHEAVKPFLWTWAALLALLVIFQDVLIQLEINFSAIVLLVLFCFIVFIFFEVSDNAKIKEEVARILELSNDRLDEERKIISIELHDSLNPKLILAKQKLVIALKKNDLLVASEDIHHAIDYINSAYQDVRNIICNTRSEIVESIGLTVALESLIGHYKGVFDKPSIALEHNLPRHPNLPKNVSLGLFRILQEAIINVIKHAEADHLYINISENKQIYAVTIRDNGKGIGSLSGMSKDGIGLIDMRRRVKKLGGDLKIEVPPQGGTVLSFSFRAPEVKMIIDRN